MNSLPRIDELPLERRLAAARRASAVAMFYLHAQVCSAGLAADLTASAFKVHPRTVQRWVSRTANFFDDPKPALAGLASRGADA